MDSEHTVEAFHEGGLFYKPGFGIAAWEALKIRLPAGSFLTGRVVYQFHFGVFIDAGLGFQVLAEVPSFGFRGIRFPEDYPPLESSINGRIADFMEGNRQIRLLDSSVVLPK